MNILEMAQRNSVVGSARQGTQKLLRFVRSRYLEVRYPAWRFRDAPHYASPTPAALVTIERDLRSLGVSVEDYAPPVDRFERFKAERWFPPDYYGGPTGDVWDEKLLEHWIASERLGLSEFGADDIYVDIAAAESPWARELRERCGLKAFAIDQGPVAYAYRSLGYYRREDATQTGFPDESIRGASLHCAYEMFTGENDTRLIGELARILRPGGKAVILPLYMHSHYCAYATPEHFGKGYADPAAKEYVRVNCYGVRSSRKYDARTLQRRVLTPLQNAGLRHRILALRNKESLGVGIYCHFILEIEK